MNTQSTINAINHLFDSFHAYWGLIFRLKHSRLSIGGLRQQNIIFFFDRVDIIITEIVQLGRKLVELNTNMCLTGLLFQCLNCRQNIGVFIAEFSLHHIHFSHQMMNGPVEILHSLKLGLNSSQDHFEHIDDFCLAGIL